MYRGTGDRPRVFHGNKSLKYHHQWILYAPLAILQGPPSEDPPLTEHEVLLEDPTLSD